MWEKLKGSPVISTIMSIIKGLISIGILFGMFFLFRYIGLKGLLGFVLGMGLMAFLFLSKNPLLKWAVDFATAEGYVDEMSKKSDDAEVVEKVKR